jgi:hypothetical protein
MWIGRLDDRPCRAGRAGAWCRPDADALGYARSRCSAHGLSAHFLQLNAAQMRPDLHPAFFEEYLDIIIRKGRD